MTKFRVKLKLTGLELEIEGSREDVPLLTRSIADQLAGVITPAARIVEGKAMPAIIGRDPIANNSATIVEATPASSRTAKKRRPTSSNGGGAQGAGASAAIVWPHDADTWGNPLLTWVAVDKAIWLLYVANKVGAVSEMSVNQMVVTFEKLFRTAGKLNRGNIARDFGKLNAEPPPKVQMNGTAEPNTWYLTDAGIKLAERLVRAARGVPETQA